MRRLAARSGFSHELGDHPEDAQASSFVLPGFCPAVYPFFKDCLSRTSRLPQQTGTLDAHLNESCANAVPSESWLPRAHGFSRKSRGLGVVSMRRADSWRSAGMRMPHYERAIRSSGAPDSRAACAPTMGIYARSVGARDSSVYHLSRRQTPTAAPSLRGSLAPSNSPARECTMAPACPIT